MHDPVTWYGINYAETQITQGCRAGLVRVPLFWESHCVICVSASFILYHVTGSCKGPIEECTDEMRSSNRDSISDIRKPSQPTYLDYDSIRNQYWWQFIHPEEGSNAETSVVLYRHLVSIKYILTLTCKHKEPG